MQFLVLVFRAVLQTTGRRKGARRCEGWYETFNHETTRCKVDNFSIRLPLIRIGDCSWWVHRGRIVEALDEDETEDQAVSGEDPFQELDWQSLFTFSLYKCMHVSDLGVFPVTCIFDQIAFYLKHLKCCQFAFFWPCIYSGITVYKQSKDDAWNQSST